MKKGEIKESWFLVDSANNETSLRGMSESQRIEFAKSIARKTNEDVFIVRKVEQVLFQISPSRPKDIKQQELSFG